jgi:ferredoxin
MPGVPYSCREGLCATCRTTVLAGEVDHRDSVLTAAERASNKEMMICVSRAKSKVLELEL